MHLIDTHAHLFDIRFKEDLAEVLERAFGEGVEKIVLPAIDSETHEDLRRLAENHPGRLFATVGLHPTSVNENPEWKKELALVENLLTSGRTRFYAIGETGVDLYWSKDFVREQEEAFRFQIELAIRHDLPVIVHIREALDETISILTDYAGRGVRGVFHSFSGTDEQYHRMRRLGDFRFGIGGVVTYKKVAIAETVQLMDIRDIVLETDAPYLPPVPYRGKRNESSYVQLVAGKISQLKGISPEETARITTRNAETLFRF